jgi:hypothetical protein
VQVAVVVPRDSDRVTGHMLAILRRFCAGFWHRAEDFWEDMGILELGQEHKI